MTIEIQQIGPELLPHYATVPISFTVCSRLNIIPIDRGLGGIRLEEVPVAPPYVKDYDIDELPTDWPKKFDIHNWTFFLALAGGNRPVGAAAVGYDTPGIYMLEGRQDLTVLWDIRVHPEFRGRGVGAQLFHTAAEWSRTRRVKDPTGRWIKVRQMKIETQNINVNACRFYARMGAVVGAIHQYAYSTTYPEECMLLWYKDLLSL